MSKSKKKKKNTGQEIVFLQVSGQALYREGLGSALVISHNLAVPGSWSWATNNRLSRPEADPTNRWTESNRYISVISRRGLGWSHWKAGSRYIHPFCRTLEVHNPHLQYRHVLLFPRCQLYSNGRCHCVQPWSVLHPGSLSNSHRLAGCVTQTGMRRVVFTFTCYICAFQPDASDFSKPLLLYAHCLSGKTGTLQGPSNLPV